MRSGECVIQDRKHLLAYLGRLLQGNRDLLEIAELYLLTGYLRDIQDIYGVASVHPHEIARETAEQVGKRIADSETLCLLADTDILVLRFEIEHGTWHYDMGHAIRILQDEGLFFRQKGDRLHIPGVFHEEFPDALGCVLEHRCRDVQMHKLRALGSEPPDKRCAPIDIRLVLTQHPSADERDTGMRITVDAGVGIYRIFKLCKQGLRLDAEVDDADLPDPGAAAKGPAKVQSSARKGMHSFTWQAISWRMNSREMDVGSDLSKLPLIRNMRNIRTASSLSESAD